MLQMYILSKAGSSAGRCFAWKFKFYSPPKCKICLLLIGALKVKIVKKMLFNIHNCTCILLIIYKLNMSVTHTFA